MAWPVYSELLFKASPNNVWEQWYVPTGKRAVVKSVSAVNTQPAIARVDVSVAGYVVWIHNFPAAITSEVLAVMWVAYAGQHLGIRTSTSNASCVLCGYLFDDPGGLQGDPAGEPAPPGWVPTPAPPALV